MRIIPVVDVMAGSVVRAVGGRRDEYRPLAPQLFGSNDPVLVANAMLRRARAVELYLADLDAILGKSSSLILDDFADLGASRWVDAGVRLVEDALRVAQRGADRVILGSETVANPDVVTGAVCELGRERVIFSLDLRAGRPLAAWGNWATSSPFDIAAEVASLGVTHIIVLDLAAVGERCGPGTESLCERIRVELPDLQVVVGGGIRGQADLDRFAALGVEAALVGSALHDGELNHDIADSC